MRKMLSVSITMSSSRKSTYFERSALRVSYWARAKPPEPPRLACSMTLRRPSSAASAAGAPGHRQPSGCLTPATTTSSTSADTSGSSLICLISFAQKSGRFMVVIPTVQLPASKRSAGTSASQVAATKVAIYLARHHIKPIPTTILEWHQGQVKGEGLGIGPLHLASINSLRATIGH